MDKSKLLKAAPVVGVIVLSAAACALAGYIIARWPIIDASLKPAIVSGAFTILAAMGGALVVFWQLRKQAENTAKSNLHSEQIKLKKEIYEELLDACHDVIEAVATVESYVQDFHTYVYKQKEVVEVADMEAT